MVDAKRGVDPPAPKSLRERWAALGNIPSFVALAWSAGGTLVLASAALQTVRALAPVAALWIGKLIIDDVAALAGQPDRPQTFAAWLADPRGEKILALAAAEFALAVGLDVVGRLIGYVDSLLSERISIVASQRLMRHAATLDLEDFEDAAFQDKLERARRQSSGRLTLVGLLAHQAQALLAVATLAVGLLAYNPWLILLLIASLVPAFLGEAHFNAQSYVLDFRRTPERRELDYVRSVAASAETAKEVKIFGLHGFLSERYRVLSERFYAANRAVARRRAAWGSLFAIVGAAGYYVAYLWIVARTVSGQLSLGDLTFLAGSFLRMRGLIEQLLSTFSITATQAFYLGDLFDFFEARPRIVSKPSPAPTPSPIREGFVFEDVGFRYPGVERWAVRHLSFTLRAGETLALVGENGAGKTTLVKLLARLYDPTEGRITLDGRDLRDYDVDALRDAIGVIFQDFVRYNLPARDNVAVGRIAARDNLARIQASARAAMADQVIETLPEGYEQMIGKRFRAGVELSGGEWQKIAIARAYMREAQVLILDEPTAALDARSEYEVFKRFKELSAGKTAALISHRFSSVRMADRILVLADGRVEDQGTHDELMARAGRYAELFELQAAGYR